MIEQVKRFWSKVDKNGANGCWNWQGWKDRQGYGHAIIKRRKVKAHRFSWMIYNAVIPAGLCVLHKCDNPSCVNPEHLFLGTRKDNAVDKMNKGRCLYGEKHCLVKITEEQAMSILSDPRSNYAIGKEYGISNQQVSRIKTGKRWRHLSGAEQTG